MYTIKQVIEERMHPSLTLKYKISNSTLIPRDLMLTYDFKTVTQKASNCFISKWFWCLKRSETPVTDNQMSDDGKAFSWTTNEMLRKWKKKGTLILRKLMSRRQFLMFEISTYSNTFTFNSIFSILSFLFVIFQVNK